MTTIIFLVLAIFMLLLLLGVSSLFLFFGQEFRAIIAARRNRGRDILCLRCTDCCRKTVVLSSADLERLQEFTGDSQIVFTSRWTWLKLLKKSNSGHCVFHRQSVDDKVSVCSVYPARPDACRRFPHLRYFGQAALDSRCQAVRKHNRQGHAK